MSRERQSDVAPSPPSPVRVPVLLQDWKSCAFIHWRYSPEAIQASLPSALTVDTFDGSAWVSLTPFLVERGRPPGMPSVPGMRRYGETNLRTYVIGPNGRRGIWFYALDCAATAPVLLGRGAYFQPYYRSNIFIEAESGKYLYKGSRRWPGGPAAYVVEIELDHRPAEIDELDVFLTGRWIFFTLYGAVTAKAHVEHEPWPLRRAHIRECEQTLAQAAGLPPSGTAPIAHFADVVHAKLGPPQPVSIRRGRPS